MIRTHILGQITLIKTDELSTLANKQTIYVYVTLDVPWFEFVEVDVADDVKVDFLGGDFLAEVVVEELLLGGVEAEARGDLGVSIHRQVHVVRH